MAPLPPLVTPMMSSLYCTR